MTTGGDRRLRSRGRKPGSPSAGDCFKPQVPLASAAPKHRSADLRLAVSILPVDSKYNRHSQAGDGDPLAQRAYFQRCDTSVSSRANISSTNLKRKTRLCRSSHQCDGDALKAVEI